MIFIDTNVLLYAICPGLEERAKAEQAREILRRNDLALSVQVLQEFYVQATRPTRTDPLNHREATALIEVWLRLSVTGLSVALLQTALRLKDRYRISYWDAAIIAAARELGCQTLFSEDLNHGQDYDGVKVVNPFNC